MKFKQKLNKYSRTIHKWVGLFIGVQVLFWIGGGLLMSSLPLNKVHGDHLHNPQKLSASKFDAYKQPLRQVLQTAQLNPTEVKFYQVKGVPIYEVKDQQTYYFSGLTGKALKPLDKQTIISYAKKLFTGSEPILNARKIENIPMEAARLNAPVWKIVFADSISTTFYINPINGKLLMVRSDLWRLFDFVWMLHIMDYDSRDDFNNPLLITFAASAFVFTLSGLILIVQVFRRRDFQFFKKT